MHIIGHVPPGLADCMEAWSREYHRVITRYQNTVKAQFFGHTHYDEFVVFFDEKDRQKPINVGYVAPSVTTYSFLNPSYRIYSSDSKFNVGPAEAKFNCSNSLNSYG